MPVTKPQSTKKNKSVSLPRGYGGSSVYEALRREILELNLAPGSLLDEVELAERFNLSRSPVREALIRLAGEGLVVTLRNRSSIVAPFDISTVPNYFDAISLLYRLTSRLAALNRTPAQLDRIKAIHAEHERAAELADRSKLVELNREFHLAIAEAGGNVFFKQWLTMLLDQGRRILGVYIRDYDDHLPKTSLDEHIALVLAIEGRSPDAAERAGGRDADILGDQIRAKLVEKRIVSFTLG